ncbi:nuclear transport factor 2 family protein [Nocardia sp. alder85J]|uniref:nuclear transport factor 2 family protein n=1 Tax=Nocardia sp. alder85J TaxID=2862949 RepID=UPI001CD4FFE9|nr:nuclear transport factor 2 family protein [Nocardia sp. alder85J]MCX4095878.1 nuclear transport factor 2 family protein [Nocardia sp. alder85J]
MDIQRIGDTLEIQALLSAYARAVDTRDWALYRSLFTADAVLDYTSAPFGRSGPRDEIVEWLRESMAVLPMTQHLVTNIEADIDGDTAAVRALFYNPMRFPGFAEPSFCGGTYHHSMIRTADGWRSRGLREENAWFTNNPLTAGQ